MQNRLPLIIIASCILVIAGYLVLSANNKNKQEPVPNVSLPTQIVAVPPPTAEDIIKSFINLINEKKIPEAITLIDPKITNDESVKQQLGVNFNSLTEVSIKLIEPHSRAAWTNNQETYKVMLNAQVAPQVTTAPIPNYGWNNGENTRWITLTKDDNGLWKIFEIATGP